MDISDNTIFFVFVETDNSVVVIFEFDRLKALSLAVKLTSGPR